MTSQDEHVQRIVEDVTVREAFNALSLDDLCKDVTKISSTLEPTISDRHSPKICLLPSELLSHIFTFCIATFHPLNPRRSYIESGTITPLFLGSICRRWREVSWMTPQLWSTLYIHLVSQNIKVVNQLIVQWLYRSGQLPLDICISCKNTIDRNYDMRQFKNELLDLIRTVNHYSDRWRYLGILIPASFFENFTSSPNCPLEYLYIDPPDGQPVNDKSYPLSMEGLTKLKKLHLSSVYLKCFKLQWENITHISAYSFYVGECLKLLRLCPQLVCCSFPCVIDSINEDSEEKHDIKTIFIPTLKFLSLGCEVQFDTSSILDKLVLPSLEEFQYNSYQNALEIESILSLINRSSCSIRTFCLQSARLPTIEMHLLFKGMPTLKKLLIFSKIQLANDRTLTNIFVNDVGLGTDILPDLEILEYKGNQAFAWADLPSILEGTSPASTVPIRRPLRAAKITVTDFCRPYFFYRKQISRYMAFLKKGSLLWLYNEDSNDLLECILSCYNDSELHDYINLRKKRQLLFDEYFVESDQWLV